MMETREPTGAAQLVADALLRAGAIRVSSGQPFVLTSGKLSPLYFDCRRLISDPAAMNLIAALFHSELNRIGVRPDVVAGGESAGIPFADRLAAMLNVPLVYVRKEAKSHGTAGSVEGILESGARVVLVEDLITDGMSKMRFVEALRRAGAILDHILVVLDREQGGTQVLSKFDLELHALCTARTAIEFGVHSGRLDQKQSAAALAYLSDPDGWQPH
jgi:orotate phosphoribosyltransferase